jgi:hypothetical protein
MFETLTEIYNAYCNTIFIFRDLGMFLCFFIVRQCLTTLFTDVNMIKMC